MADISKIIIPSDTDVLQFATPTSRTHNDVTFTFNSDNSCAVSGKASSLATGVYYSSSSAMPDWITPGETYSIEYSGTNVALGIYTYHNGTMDTPALVSTYTDTTVTIPSDTTGLQIRLAVSSGVTANETVHPKLIHHMHMYYLKDINAARLSDINDIRTMIDGSNGLTGIEKPLRIGTDGVWAVPSGAHVCLSINPGDVFSITGASSVGTNYAILTSSDAVLNSTAAFSSETGFTSRFDVSANTSTGNITAPSDAEYLYIATKTNGGANQVPASVLINGVELTYNIRKKIDELNTESNYTIKTNGNYSTIIGDNTDFDSITTAGEYRVANTTSAGTMSNIPINRPGRLIVAGLTGASKNIQFYASTTNHYYIRYFTSSSVWSDWEEIPHGFTKSDFDLVRHNTTEYIAGTWSSTSGTWTGTTEDDELYDGKKIILFMPYAGSGNATLNLTLSGGTTTGAKNVYYSGTTRMSTQYPQYSHVMLIYHNSLSIGGSNYEGWWAVSAPPIYDGTVV